MSNRSNTYVILGVTLALLLALAGSLVPYSVEASSSRMGKHHSGYGYHANHGRYHGMGSAHYQPPKPPKKIVREQFAPDECVGWGYVRKGGGYRRFHKPCRYGNETQDYSNDYRSLFAPVVPIAGTMMAEEEGAVEAVVAEEVPAEEEMAEEAPAEEEAVEEAPVEEEAVEEAPAEEEAVEEAPAEEEAVEEAPVEEEMAEEVETSEDIVGTVNASDGLSTFVELVEAAGLVDSLKGEGPFTVFAPINEAFDNLPDGLLDAMLADASGELTPILLHHVVPGIIPSDEISDGMVAETLDGDSITFGVDGESVTVDGALVIAADIETSNGVVHVIDAVLLPPVE